MALRELDRLCERLGVSFITSPAVAPVRFSVVTLLRDEDNYARLLRSFEAGGFGPENTQFIAIDNRGANRFDGYSALRAVLPEIRGEHILFTHDDIELIDEGIEELSRVLSELSARDPNWMVAGNAGLSTPARGRRVRSLCHIRDPHGKFRPVSEPVRVQSLDENFLVLRRDRLVLPSVDIGGFHLFATDLCLQAEFAGGGAYVIPFLLRHHSAGSASPEFDRVRARFIEKYAPYLGSRVLETPVTLMAFNCAGRAKLMAHEALRSAEILLCRILRKIQPNPEPSSGSGL